MRDQSGKPTQAALGVTIVDESVFALQEMQPGLERVYFALEKELLQPRYEIHGFTPEGIISGELPFTKPSRPAARTRASAPPPCSSPPPRWPSRSPLHVNTYQERFEKAKDAWVEEMRRDAERIDRALKRYYEAHREYLPEQTQDITTLVDEGLLQALRPPRPLGARLPRALVARSNCWLDSAGPDGKWDTTDDISAR